MSRKNDVLGPVTRALVGVPQDRLGIVADIANRLNAKDGDAFCRDLKLFLESRHKMLGVFMELHLCLNFHDVRNVVNLVTGGQPLTAEHIEEWGGLIMAAVNHMRASYEHNLRIPVDDALLAYFARDWQAMDEAKTPEKLVKAIKGLMESIHWK